MSATLAMPGAPDMTPEEARCVYVLRLADTSLVLGQRLAEWIGHAPALEEDLGLANLSLDLIGQARLFLTYAGELEGRGRDEDALAFLRDAPEFLNLALAEQPNGDFGHTIVRQWLIDAWQLELYSALEHSADTRLAAIAARRSSADVARLAYTSSCQASMSHWRTTVSPKSPFGCSARVRLANSGASRRKASASSSRPRPSSSPAYVRSSRAWPMRSSERLASPRSSSSAGAWPIHSARRWPSTSEVSARRRT